MFIYRPEYYQIHEWDDDASPTAGQAEIMIAKNRHGALENIRLRFINDFTKFTDLMEDSYIQSNNDILADNPGFITISSRLNEDDESHESFSPAPF
jgi:replicative DNA helicase